MAGELEEAGIHLHVAQVGEAQDRGRRRVRAEGPLEALLGVVGGVRGTQAQARGRDGADAAPLAVAGLEHLGDELLRLRDLRTRHPRFEPDNLARNLELVRQVEEVARAKGTGLPQLVLAWLLALSPVMIPIPGASRPESVTDSVKAVSLELSHEELQAVGGIAQTA